MMPFYIKLSLSNIAW